MIFFLGEDDCVCCDNDVLSFFFKCGMLSLIGGWSFIFVGFMGGNILNFELFMELFEFDSFFLLEDDELLEIEFFVFVDF